MDGSPSVNRDGTREDKRMSVPTKCELCGKPFTRQTITTAQGDKPVTFSTARYLVEIPGAGIAEACADCKHALDTDQEQIAGTRYDVKRVRSMDRRGMRYQ
jgi:hypothetical protein